jgi:hypothetical protein
MSQSRAERFIRQLQGKPVPKKPINENDAVAKAAEDRALSDADLERVTGGAGEDWGRARR